jgi:hypothetical protein
MLGIPTLKFSVRNCFIAILDLEILLIDCNAATLARCIESEGCLINFETSVSKILTRVAIINMFKVLGLLTLYCKVSKCKFYL